MKKIIAMILAAAMVLALVPMTAMAETTVSVSNFADLKKEIENKTADIIEIDTPFTFNGSITVSRKVTIDGKGYTVTRGSTYTGTFLDVTATGSLVLKNLTVDGNNNWKLDEAKFNNLLTKRSADVAADPTLVQDLVIPESGKPVAAGFTITTKGDVTVDGCTFKNNYSKNRGIINCTGNATTPPTVTLKNSTFSHNTNYADASAIAHGGTASYTIIVDEGTMITDNFAGRNGGMFRIDNGTLEIKGGTFSNNKTVDTNGVIAMAYGSGSMIKMSGGVIENNVGVTGASNGRNSMLYMHSSSKLEMTGGTIRNNSSQSYGGVDSNRTSGVEINISGGTITGNISRLGNANADVNASNPDMVTITGGTFSQDVTEFLAAGIGLWLNPATGLYEAMPESMIPVPEAPIPETGDGMGLFVFAGLALISVLGMVVLKKREQF